MSEELQLLFTASLEIIRHHQASGEKPLRWALIVIIIKVSHEPLGKFKNYQYQDIIVGCTSTASSLLEPVQSKMAATANTKRAQIQSSLHILS